MPILLEHQRPRRTPWQRSDRRHRDRHPDRGAGPGLEGEHAGDAGGEGDQRGRVVGLGKGAEAALVDVEAIGEKAGPFEEGAQHHRGDDDEAETEG